MRVIDAVPGSKIYVGQQLEDKATMVRFDASPFYSLYGDEGTFSLRVQRYGEAEGYPIGYPSVYAEDGYVCWILGESDAAIAGENEVQLRYITDDAVSMSMKFTYVVKESIVTGDTIPAPMKEWAEVILDAAAEIIPMPEDMVRVPTTDALETILGIEDGAVKQIDVDDIIPVIPDIPTDASDISYSNLTSGLAADNVQEAIDDLSQTTLSYTSGSASVAPSTITDICSATIPTSGVWLLISKAQFSVSQDLTYNHYLFFGTNNTVVRNSMVQGGGSTNVHAGAFASGTVIKVSAYHAGSDSATCSADLILVRLGNSTN